MNRIPPVLDRALRGVHRRDRRLAVSARALAAFTAGLLGLTAAVLLDALARLPPGGRAAVQALAWAFAAAVPLLLVHAARRLRYRPDRVALQVQERTAIPAGRLINAVDLATGAPAGASAALVDAAIRRGEEAAAAIDPTQVVDRARLRRPFRAALAAAGAVALLAVALPGAWRAALPRFARPRADLPPFTRLRFDVSVRPERVYVGQEAAVRVRIDGPRPPEEAAAVVREPGQPPAVLPMWREPDPEEGGTAFSLRMEWLEASREFYIDTRGGRSRTHRLEVSREPLIEGVALRIEPPAYSGRPPVGAPLGQAGIRALRGSRIEVAARSNVPLSGGRLRLRPLAGTGAEMPPEETVELAPDPDDPRTARGAFTLAWSGDFALELAGADGAPGAAPREGALVAVPDRPPQVAILDPEAVSVAPEGWTVPVLVEASDDIGLAALELRVRVDAGPFAAHALEGASDADPRRRQAAHDLDLDAADAAAGAVVGLFALARDTAPDGGQVAETPVHRLHVVTMEEYLDLARAAYGLEHLAAEWAAYMEALTDLAAARAEALRRLDAWESALAAGADAAAERAALEQALADYADRAADGAERMRQRTGTADLYEAEGPFKDRLRELAAALDGQAADADALRGAAPGEAAVAAAGRFRANDDPFGAAADGAELAADLDALERAGRIAMQAVRLQSVIERQRDLADRLAAADGIAGGESRLTALGREQLRLEEELRSAVADLAQAAVEHAERLPNLAASAGRLAEAAESLAAWDDQAAAAAACPARPAEAAKHAELAARKLETLLSDCQGMGAGDGAADGCIVLTRPQVTASIRQMTQGFQLAMAMGFGGFGGMGAGQAGHMPTVSMTGPALPGLDTMAAADVAGRSPHADAGRGRGGTESAPAERGRVDVVRTETTLAEAGDARPLPGVPAAYRELAEAYFRRLARDAAGEPAGEGRIMP